MADSQVFYIIFIDLAYIYTNDKYKLQGKP